MPADTTGIVTASDYTLKALMIISSDGQGVDIKKLAVEINLYEDIFSPTMSGDILMGDGLDLISAYGFHGNEWLSIVIDKPGFNNPIDKVFRIYKISKRSPATAAGLQNYLIHFCSEELLLSNQRLISKSYKGMTTASIISDILKSKLGVSPQKLAKGIFDTTDGVFNIIIPKMQPFEAINWLATRSYSSTGTLYLFFENRDGYNFVSFETLISQQVYATYTYRPKVNSEAADSFRSITNLNILQDFDMISSAQYGAFTSAIMTYDFVNRKINSKIFDGRNFKRLNKGVPVNDSVNRFDQSTFDSADYLLKFYPVTDSDPLTNPAKPDNWLQQKSTKLAQIHAFKMVITVPGDVQLKVGQILEVIIPAATLQTDDTEKVDMRSGNYMISALHHIFRDDRMTSVVELLGDSVVDGVFSSDNDNPSMKQVKKL